MSCGISSLRTRAWPRVHGGNPRDAQRAGTGQPLLDFSVDVHPLGLPLRLRDIVVRHLDDLGGYPDPDARALCEAIAAHHQVPAQTVLPGNGSAELIGLVTRLRPSPKVVVIVPTFTEYEWAARQAGGSLTLHALDERAEFQWDDRTTAAWPSIIAGSDLVFLCNPNNPTGVAIPKATVLSLARRCEQAGTLLVVDEAFVEFTEAPREISVLPEALALSHVIVLRSLTKWWAMPGLRLGYLVAAPPLVHALRAQQQPWPVNALALAVGVELLSQPDDRGPHRQQLREWREALWHALAAMPGLTPFPTTTNFILCKLDTPYVTSTELAQRLAARGLLIRNCDGFSGLAPGRFIRVAVRTPSDNERLLAALHETLRSCDDAQLMTS